MLPFILPLLISAVVCALVAMHAWGQRPRPTSRSFAIVNILLVVWSLGYAMEIAVPSLSSKLFWEKVVLAPYSLVPISLLVLVSRFTGQSRGLVKPTLLSWPRLLVLAM